MTERDDAELDRLLAKGRESGPELDRLWAKIAPEVEAKKPKRSWLRWAGLVLAPIAATVAVVALQPDAFTPRGDGDVKRVRLEATCGAEDAPCKVGAKVYLSLESAEAGAAYLLAIEATKRSLLTGPLTLEPNKALALPIALETEESDVPNGIVLEPLLFERALSKEKLEALLDPTRPASPDRLRLKVVR